MIQNFNRNEKNTIEKSIQLKILEDQLTQIKPEIERLTNLSKKQSDELEIADKEFNAWLPKFDLITKLDGQLKNESENKQKSIARLDELKLQIEALQGEKNKLSKKLVETEDKIKTDEVFVAENKFLLDVDLQISNWTSGLTTLKANKESLNENLLFVSNKTKEVEITNSELAKNKELLNNKIVEIEKVEKEIILINNQLAKNNLTDLLAEQKRLSLTELNWKQFKSLFEESTKEEKELNSLVAKKELFSTELEVNKKHIEAVIKEIEIQNKFVSDAEKILELEKSISKYENDRQNLEEGKPCGLCGSTEHPFTENLESIGVSKSELELNTRKDKLKKLIDSKSELERAEVKLSTSIDNLTKQIESIIEDLKAIQLKAKQLNIDCELTNIAKINIELNLSSEKNKLLDDKIKSAQQAQIKKDNLSNTSKEQNKIIEILKTKDATISEKIKNVVAEIDSKQKSITILTKVCKDLEDSLKTKLTKFNYSLPSIENTNLFIETIEKDILKYNKIQKDIDILKSDVKVLDSNLISTEKQLVTHSKTLKDSIETLEKVEFELERLKTERIAILPIVITVESKRKSLQLVSKQLFEEVEKSTKELQKVLDLKIKNEALKDENIKEQNNLIDELALLNSSLNTQLEESDFNTKQDIENALLTKEDKLKYTANKERIKESKLKLKTLNEVNSKAKEDLNKSKNFETSEVESKIVFDELKTKKENLIAEKGEIKEAFRKDQEIKDRNQETYKKIETQQTICNVWKELFRIIGNSKDAFNVYVQRLTLKHLLDLANVHLYKLNKRYSLKMEEAYKPKEELNFNLIDHYQTDQARLVDTSSGGEKFIISLALALGLSDLASKNVKIDSLFIDEGFGTLDSNTLETVISTLETLQSQGKMIGIISHVENLKERIPTQIQITKKSNGVSVVDII